MTAQERTPTASSAFRIPSRARLSALLGSRSALSLPVIAAFIVVGFVLSFAYLKLVSGESVFPTGIKAVFTLVVPCGLLLVVRASANRRGWTRPRVWLVLVTVSLASVLRSPLGIGAVTEWNVVRSDEANPIGRTVGALLITLGIMLTLGAVVHVARERSEARAVLLAEQARLRELVAVTSEGLARAESELRARAGELLEPTISEIRLLLQGELSEAEARAASSRITEVVNEVVRPTSRQLAQPPSFAFGELGPQRPAIVRLLTDRLDVTKAIRPGLVMLLAWGVVAPGLLIVGPDWQVLGVAFSTCLAALLVLYLVKVIWPQRLRTMPVALGLGILTALYLIVISVIQMWIEQRGSILGAHVAWAVMSRVNLAFWVVLAMLVSVLAMLNEHGRQNRASLAELNIELEEHLARLRREAWLLHRTVALAVHGPVQSALVSTAMRLSASDRTEESVNDARRRLDHALSAIEHDHHEVLSVDDALADLTGLWKPVVQIRADVWPNAESRLADNYGLRRCVIEICREATSNAIRHGQARVVDISLIGVGETIVIRVSDDGDGVPSDPISGLGTAMLDDTCLRWTLLNRPEGGAELSAYVV
ncbi:MAG: hypothetical protein F2793_10445 [Actinobacteria bacterium]|uniref:Unannotated protein n=1 Tax=freshwater metagenome TaxID=449393 RepID=A0A6J7F1Q2_9ZZZZ|nr:hypothetical protein [Actinomycetota bacterium]